MAERKSDLAFAAFFGGGKSGSGSGGSVTVDAALSETSENPVQNKVIKAALDGKGTYSKPSDGIPKSDLASAVQTSLGKADTALQAAPVTSVNGKTGAVVLSAADVGAAPLQLTATPTAGPSGTTLMSGTWSGATWEEVMAAVLASRLIQIDVAIIGKITLLYNLGSETGASSNAFVYNVGGVLFNIFAELLIVNGNHKFYLSIINTQTETVNVTGTTPTITPADNTIYNCGEVASLTISNPPATGAYSIVFTSGSTATVTAFPATILGLEDFAAEANTIYEINVLDNRAVAGSWAVSA